MSHIILKRGEDYLQVSGLGIARFMDLQKRRDPYMAPGAEMSREADVYAFGIILHEMLTGGVPTIPQSRLVDLSYLPREFDQLLSSCLELLPRDRKPASAIVRMLSSMDISMTGLFIKLARFAPTSPYEKTINEQMRREMQNFTGVVFTNGYFPLDPKHPELVSEIDVVVVSEYGITIFDIKGRTAIASNEVASINKLVKRIGGFRNLLKGLKLTPKADQKEYVNGFILVPDHVFYSNLDYNLQHHIKTISDAVTYLMQGGGGFPQRLDLKQINEVALFLGKAARDYFNVGRRIGDFRIDRMLPKQGATEVICSRRKQKFLLRERRLEDIINHWC